MGTRRCSVLDTPGVLGRAVRRFSPNAEDGFTLIEMLVVMIVLLAILAPLTGSFVSAQTAQVDQTRRLDAQENARQALDRMRKDIHCAHGVTRSVRERLGRIHDRDDGDEHDRGRRMPRISFRPTPPAYSGAPFPLPGPRTGTSSTGRTIPTTRATAAGRRSWSTT